MDHITEEKKDWKRSGTKQVTVDQQSNSNDQPVRERQD
jgi:hypothetical protein